MKKKRIGESKLMNCGFKATIIGYRGSGDIDIQFENGMVVCNRAYVNFERGTIKIPTKIEYADDYAVCTNLVSGVSFLIDIDDLDKIKNKSLHISGKGYIAWYDPLGSSRGSKTYLAPTLINCPKNMFIDHIDGNKLNNRKSNLRICTRQQNVCNSKKRTDARTSSYRGVSYNYKNNKWKTGIMANGIRYDLGSFDKEEDAAIAYNVAAKTYHGEFARLNDI